MKGKRPWQVICLSIIYIICFVFVVCVIFDQLFIEGKIVMLVFPLYFGLLFALTYIKKPWSFGVNVIQLLPICFIAIGASRLIPMILFILALPVLPVAYLLFCPATLKYFKIKKDKNVVQKRNVEIEEPNELWECPNCKSNNLNTKFVCDDCGYSIN